METTRRSCQKPALAQDIDNALYDELGDRWYSAKDHPIALLRAESQARNPWVRQTIATNFRNRKIKLLDVACGGGFLSNPLAQAGHQVTGVDLSVESLEVAKRHDLTRSVRYLAADAHALPFADDEFEVVCAMDFLEHVEDPVSAIREMSRVLKPGGLFFFHTFNRNPISTFVVIKLVEWFVKNTPPRLHVPHLFIKPRELKRFCANAGLEVAEMRGLLPHLFSLPVLKGFLSGKVEEGFRFFFAKSLLVSYCGFAKKI